MTTGDILLIERPINVRFRKDYKAVIILDQSKLPNHTEFIDLVTKEDMYQAILKLKVRGAPAIGICAAFCYAVYANLFFSEAFAEERLGKNPVCRELFLNELFTFKKYLASCRPTAVNLFWALERMEKALLAEVEELPKDCELTIDSASSIVNRLIGEACKIQYEDISMCKAISEYGLSLLKDGDGILTHCNAGPLATSHYGTALGPALLGHERGINIKVFADETRPLLQGARLTAYELHKAGVPVTLICDNMASIVMKNGWIQACMVGCDRIASNGDCANKIGSSGVAILAKHYNIPFYVMGPTSTIDFSCRSGDDIPIELRSGEEISEKYFSEPIAPSGINLYNPAFDIIDHELITAIITEKGIVRAPFDTGLLQ
ncbi:MAG: S-methyl-5-thioribose-1-phosphate isomerase [Lachnospiraceae bacterium]|jgi:methylthioribose-1-phosphate isomerase|nr:S-methyl-5-thioribose-1-phosphate isomerase [Lachnospiraceae bacterium]